MESCFLNLARGNRLSMYMGLQMSPGKSYKYAQDYSYLEIPVQELYNPTSEEVVHKAVRNQTLRVIPACRVDLRGSYKILVKTNPALQEVANCPAIFLLDSGLGEQPGFTASFRKDMDIQDLAWCVRLYLIP